jgi:hypothetical protein
MLEAELLVFHGFGEQFWLLLASLLVHEYLEHVFSVLFERPLVLYESA